MIGVPQLGGHEDVFACDPCGRKPCLQRFADLALVPVSLGAIEVSIAGFQRFSGSAEGRSYIGNQRAESKRGHTAASVIQHDLFAPKIGRLNHGDTSAIVHARRRRIGAGACKNPFFQAGLVLNVRKVKPSKRVSLICCSAVAIRVKPSTKQVCFSTQCSK
jgi:hypothetical protein